jgi:DNA-binding NarL/FixJ family response regulator
MMTTQAPIVELNAFAEAPVSTGESISVFLFHDHPVFRSGLTWKLGDDAGIEVIGDSGAIHEAIEKARSLEPDVVVADLRIGDGDSEGVEAVEALVASLPNVPVIVYSDFYSSAYRARMEAAGASAFIMKSPAAARLVKAVREAVEKAPAGEERAQGAA